MQLSNPVNSETTSNLEENYNGEIDDLSTIDSEDGSKKVAAEKESTKSKFDVIADRIINAFTIKQQERFVESNEDTISYQDSEKRLIIFGSCLAMILNLALSALLVSAHFLSSDRVLMKNYLSIESSNDYPSPYLFIMTKLGVGDIVVLRQNKDLTFALDWTFKVPENRPQVPASPWSQLQPNRLIESSVLETGFSVFEDQGDIFIVYSDTSKKMVVLNPSKTQKHKTILGKSKLPWNHLYYSSIVRTGYYVWVFGGHSGPNALETGHFQLIADPYLNHGCSSIKYGAEKHSHTGTAIWHIEKQHWFEGPSLPIKTCSLQATAVSMNQTDVLIFVAPFLGTYFVEENGGQEWIMEKGGCITALHFSFNTFSWVSQHDCFIDFGARHVHDSHTNEYSGIFNSSNSFSNILSLSSTTLFRKDGKL